MMKIRITNAIGIHNGLVTHHHDQVIVFVNFKTKKIKNNTIPRPTPFEFDLFSDILIKDYC